MDGWLIRTTMLWREERIPREYWQPGNSVEKQEESVVHQFVYGE